MQPRLRGAATLVVQQHFGAPAVATGTGLLACGVVILFAARFPHIRRL